MINSLHLKPEVLEQKIRERFERYETIKEKEVRFEELFTEDADFVVVAYGAASRVAKSAVMQARKEGIKVGLLRPITLWPFPEKILSQLAGKAKAMLCVAVSYTHLDVYKRQM